MNNNRQIEEYEISFYNSIFREDNNELKKNSVKGNIHLGFAILFLQRNNYRLSSYNFCDFFHKKIF